MEPPAWYSQSTLLHAHTLASTDARYMPQQTRQATTATDKGQQQTHKYASKQAEAPKQPHTHIEEHSQALYAGRSQTQAKVRRHKHKYKHKHKHFATTNIQTLVLRKRKRKHTQIHCKTPASTSTTRHSKKRPPNDHDTKNTKTLTQTVDQIHKHTKLQ